MGWWAALFHGILNSNVAQKGRTLPVKGRKGGGALGPSPLEQTNRPRQHPGCRSRALSGQCLAKNDESSLRCARMRPDALGCREDRNQQVHGVTPSHWKYKNKDTYEQQRLDCSAMIHVSPNHKHKSRVNSRMFDLYFRRAVVSTAGLQTGHWFPGTRSIFIHTVTSGELCCPTSQMTNIWSKHKKKKHQLRFHGC